MTYAEAVRNLVSAGEEAGVPIAPSTPTAVDRAVFGDLSADIMATGYPGGAELPWTVEEFHLYALGELRECQAGYRTDGVTGAASPDWDQDRHVLGDWAGDPVSIGSDGSISHSRHGRESWSYARIAADLPSFLDILAKWLRYLVVERGGNVLDDDCEVDGRTRGEVREAVLSGTAPEDREAALAFLLGEA